MDDGPRYTIEQIFRFLNGPARDDADIAVMLLVLDLLAGGDPLKELGWKAEPGKRGPEVDAERIPIDHPAFAVVARLENKEPGYTRAEGGYTRAVGELQDIFDVSDKTAKKLITSLRPRARRVIDALQRLRQIGEKS